MPKAHGTTPSPRSTAQDISLERWRPEVLDYIDRHADDIVADLSDCVQHPSISGTDEENSIQARLAGRLAEIDLDVDYWQIPLAATLAAPDFPGVEVDRKEAWGLVGSAPGRGDGPSLMFNAHVDVVPPGDLTAWQAEEPFSGTVTADAVLGRGACDMKGGLIASIWAVRALRQLKVPLRGDVLLCTVQGEEDGGLGTFASLARGWRADACIIPEPTSLDIVPANAGSLTFRLSVRGLAAHSSRRTSGVSAIEKFLPIFKALRRLEARRNQVTDPLMSRWDIPYPIEIGKVQAGDWSSSVPDLLTAEGRYGVALGETADDARLEFCTAVERACADDPGCEDTRLKCSGGAGNFCPVVPRRTPRSSRHCGRRIPRFPVISNKSGLRRTAATCDS